MNIPIIIPTYQRPNLIITKTLNLLSRLEYPEKNIFVVVGCNSADEYNEYYDSISILYPNINIIVGDNRLAKASQLNFIRNNLLEDKQLAMILDDDIEDLLVRLDNKTLLPITKEQFEIFLDVAPNLMREYEVGLCGVNSSGNPYYMTDNVKLCKSCICGGFQLFFNEPNINLIGSQGTDAYESCWYLNKFGDNLKFDFLTIKTKLFSVGGLSNYRLDKKKTHNDYLYVANCYPKFLDYYTWEEGSASGFDNKGKPVSIPISRQKKLTIDLKWKRFKSKTIRKKEDLFY